MKIYSVHADANKVRSLQLSLPPDKLGDMNFNGSRISHLWSAKPVELIEEHPFVVGDFIWVEGVLGVLVGNDKALTVLKSYAGDDVEFLPLDVENSTQHYSIVNVLSVIDCLDNERSEIIYSRASGRLIAVEKYVLFENLIGATLLFKIPELVTRSVFATDAFREIVNNAGLSGLEFRELKRAL